jgi:hypothetical protein
VGRLPTSDDVEAAQLRGAALGLHAVGDGLRSSTPDPLSITDVAGRVQEKSHGEMPTWEIIQREDMITVFEFDETKRSKEGGLSLPQSIRKYFG